MRIKKTAENLVEEQLQWLTVTLERRIKMKLLQLILTLTTLMMEFNQHMLIKITDGTMLVIAASITGYQNRNFKVILNEMIWKII